MKANELRIGNLVSDICGKTLTIDRFYGKKIECDIKNMPNKDPLTNIPIYYHPITEEIEFCKPIQITEEWLLRFGFELSYKSEWVVRYSLKSNHKFTYKYNIPEGKSWLEYHGGAIDCIHVHHMQNIIYALTQTELEIETLQV